MNVHRSAAHTCHCPPTPFLCGHLGNRGDICPWKPRCLSRLPATILASHGALLSHAWAHEGHSEVGGVESSGGEREWSSQDFSVTEPTVPQPVPSPLPWVTHGTIHAPPAHLPLCPPDLTSAAPHVWTTEAEAAGSRSEIQTRYFNGPVIVRRRWKTILSTFNSLLSSMSSELCGDWILTRMDLQLQARCHYWSLF